MIDGECYEVEERTCGKDLSFRFKEKLRSIFRNSEDNRIHLRGVTLRYRVAGRRPNSPAQEVQDTRGSVSRDKTKIAEDHWN